MELIVLGSSGSWPSPGHPATFSDGVWKLSRESSDFPPQDFDLIYRKVK